MRSVGVRHGGGQNQQIAGPHCVKVSADFTPATALDAIDEDYMIDALGSAPKMTGGFGKIPCSGGDQAMQERLFAQRGLNHLFRQHDLVLPREAGAFFGAIVHSDN